VLTCRLPMIHGRNGYDCVHFMLSDVANHTSELLVHLRWHSWVNISQVNWYRYRYLVPVPRLTREFPMGLETSVDSRSTVTKWKTKIGQLYHFV
jgi:hypothetical protein